SLPNVSATRAACGGWGGVTYLYQTLAPAGAQEGAGSPGSTVAPLVPMPCVKGMLGTACALLKSSFAGCARATQPRATNPTRAEDKIIAAALSRAAQRRVLI